MMRWGLAFQLMTRFPVKTQFDAKPEDYAGSVLWFFLTALSVGAVSALAYIVFDLTAIPYLAAFISVIAAALITGGFHMDGFADMCDAFFARKGKERTLEILKDSRMGTYGVIGLVFLLVVKTLGIGVIESVTTVWPILILMPVCGKIALITCAAVSKYPRKEGLGKYIIELLPKSTAVLAIILCAALIVLLLHLILRAIWVAVAGIAAAIVVGLAVAAVARRHIGGATGDVLGAANELGEILFLIIAGILL